MSDVRTRNPLMKIPPVSIVGAILIFLPIVFFITYQNIKQQQTYTQTLLLEKGAALIRSFEAGTRAGMRGKLWGDRKLQQLLEETAQQPDITHLIVTDDKGLIIAHNNTQAVGTFHGNNLNFESVLVNPGLQWRIVELDDNSRLFEVYKIFIPSGHMGPRKPKRFGMKRQFPPPHRFPYPHFKKRPSRQIIFVGLDMAALDEAGESSTVNSVVTGTLLFLASLAGIVLLFLFQNYRSTKTSLSRIKAFSDNLVDNMPIGLVALDADGIITAVNATAEEVLDQATDALIGASGSTALPQPLQTLIEQVDRTERIIGREIQCGVKPDKTIPIEISLSIIRDDVRQKIGYALLLKDLTEIHRLRKEVVRSQKLASIGRLAAGVAHEIRNPLSSIKGFATYFRDRYRDVEKDRQTANVMINEVDRLDRVVGQLLELAKPVRIVAQKIDVESFINESIRLIKQQIQEQEIRFSIDSQSSPCLVHFDPDRINQVLLNLYLNALDAMEPQGILKLGYRYDAPADAVHITISDSGKGIEQADLTKIFDPYFTTKPTGTGLGLAIVHNILEAHQGKIKIESTPGIGTHVTVTIPNLKPEDPNER